LATRVINFSSREERVHTEGTRLIRNDRHNTLTDIFIPHQVTQQTHKGHRGGNLLLARALSGMLIRGFWWQRQSIVFFPTLWHIPSELAAALLHIFNLRSVLARMVVRHSVLIFFNLLIGDRNAVTIAEELDLIDRHFLHLVGRITTFKRSTQAVALNCVGQDDGWLAIVFGSSFIRGIDLFVVVATAFQIPDLVIGHIRYEFLGG